MFFLSVSIVCTREQKPSTNKQFANVTKISKSMSLCAFKILKTSSVFSCLSKTILFIPNCLKKETDDELKTVPIVDIIISFL